MKKGLPTIICFLVILISGCQRDSTRPLYGYTSKESPLFMAKTPEETGIYFRNDIIDSGKSNIFHTLYAYNGGGVAVGDINNDGLPDILFTGNQVSPRLYLNLGKLKFKDITKESGIDGVLPWVTGALMTDLNNDGLLDIIICRSTTNSNDTSRNQLFYLNQGDLTFMESGKEMGLGSHASTIQYYPFDLDNDGYMDLYELNHPSDFSLALNIPYYLGKDRQKDYDRLYLNKNGHYQNATEIIGLSDHGFGLSAIPTDFNNDGVEELYVANDFLEPDHFLFREKKNGQNLSMINHLNEYSNRCTLWSMGSDMGDINHDGFMDLFVVDMDNPDPSRRKTHFLPLPYGFYQLQQTNWNISQISRNSLFINKAGKALEDISDYAGTARTDWSWSPLLEDFDQDGYLDLFISSGIKRDMNDRDYTMLKFGQEDHYKFQNKRDAKNLLDSMPRSIMHNNIFKGLPACRFADKSMDWGMLSRNTQGAAVADLDNDGDLDLIVNNTDTFAFIYENKLAEKDKHYLKVYLNHPKNAFGIGTYVSCFVNGVIYKKRLSTARGYQSSSEPVLLFGFPPETKQIDSMTVQWTDGTSQKSGAQAINKTIHIIWSNTATHTPQNKDTTEYFDVYSDLSFTHTGTPGLGFLNEKLELFSNATPGPAFATGDMGGHGNIALVAGATSGHCPSITYFDRSIQKWIIKSKPFFSDSSCEDVAVAIIDINNDGLSDLYFAAGEGSSSMVDRIYINKGNYEFELCKNCIEGGLVLPKSTLAIGDIDGNGKQDLFIGIRSKPTDAADINQSYFLINSNGKLIYKALNVSGLRQYSGEIQAAVFHDMNGDGTQDLLLAGDWMPLVLLTNKQGLFSLQINSLDQYPGFWKALCISDVNGDGLPDIIAGNLGLNTIFKASKSQPMSMLRGDFDNNGQRDAIPFHYIQNKQIPFHTRDQVCLAMPALNKKFYTNKQFAKSDVYELMKEWGHNLREYTATELRSGVFINTGSSFRFEPLPYSYQMGCINSIVAVDIDNDRKTDYVFGGNSMDFQYEQGPINGFTPCVAWGGVFKKNQEFPLYNSPIKSIMLLPFEGKTLIGFGCKYGKTKFYLPHTMSAR